MLNQPAHGGGAPRRPPNRPRGGGAHSGACGTFILNFPHELKVSLGSQSGKTLKSCRYITKQYDTDVTPSTMVIVRLWWAISSTLVLARVCISTLCSPLRHCAPNPASFTPMILSTRAENQ